MLLTIQGLILGFIIVLPGMSGGTVFLIFGIYEQVIRDISRLNLRPYLPLGIGLLIGIYLGGIAFNLFFQNYRDATAAFLLGCLLASIKPVLACCPKPNKNSILAVILGLFAGLLLVDEAIGHIAIDVSVNWGLLLIGGAFASAAMLIPGIPGSAILIVLGIYDSMLFYIAELHVLNLTIFSIGSILGILLLANAVNTLYMHHRTIISYFFAGLILGSARGLLPAYFDPVFVLLFLIGFSFVWKSSTRKKEPEEEETEEEPEEETLEKQPS